MLIYTERTEMITLIGTGHVFKLSQALLNIFDEKQPDILCVELDKQRYNAMLVRQSDPEKYKKSAKNLPVIYKILAKFQDGMAKEYGVTAGEEMLTTINYAQSHQLPIAFIDMNAQVLFSKLLKSMTFSEKLKLMFSGIGGFFVNKKKVEKELDKIEGNFDHYIDEVSKKFPTIKKVLIDERNQYMVNQIKAANEKFEQVIAVVGDGHIPGITKLLKQNEVDYKSIRLSDLRKFEQKDIDPTNASFSIQHKDL